MARRGRRDGKRDIAASSSHSSRGVVLGTALGIALVGWGAWHLLNRGSGAAMPPGGLKGANLLLITIDTLRADRLGCYGSKAGLTPNLDRLAADGVRFEKVLAHVPLTLPAHTSLLTSEYPTEHGVHDNGTFRLDSSLPTLATELRQAGYRNGAFVGAFVLDARFGLDRGFDLYDDYYGEKKDFMSFVELERRAGAVVGPAERWIRQSGSPWFAWVHVFDPHTPYDAPAPFGERFPEDAYGAEVAYVDDVLGKFLQKLESTGHLANTLVVVVGDHGESLGEHGERTHGTFAYHPTLRVPWILWAGSRLRPQVFSETVRHVDVMPTVLDFLGVSVPASVEGRTLRPFLNGQEAYEPAVTYFETLNPHLTRDWAPLRGLVRERWKLIRLPIPELYDLEKDPGEENNVYPQSPEIASSLETLLDSLTQGLSDVTPAVPDLETIEKLQALGYVTAPVSERKLKYTEADDPKRLVDVSNAYDEASDLFARGETAKSLAILEDLVRKQPRSSQAHQKLAYALHQVGRLDDAVIVLERAVEGGVQEMSLLALLGSYLLEDGKVSQAKEILEDVVRRYPNYAEGHNTLGVAYARLGLEDQAGEEFEKVLELDPSSARTYNNLGSLALARGDHKEAVRLLEKALQYDPELASAHNGLGVAYARSGDMDSSIRHWRRAVDLNRQQYDALYNLALALAERSPQDALPYLGRFVREAPPARYEADIAQARALIRQIEGR